MASTPGSATMPDYALGRTTDEYGRLRAQARVWAPETDRLFQLIGLSAGDSCLDAGCGPGETMRLMARRVGPSGLVVGVDVDTALGGAAVHMLHSAGYPQCRFETVDLTEDAPLPGGPFDLVFARLLLFHLPQRVAVLARLWDAVAPGGHLLVQDYDVDAVEVIPALDSVAEIGRVLTAAFGALGCDVRAGLRLPALFAEAGLGAPDDTSVAGRLEPLAAGHVILEQTFRSVLPVALSHGVTDEREAQATLSRLEQDTRRFPGHSVLWPLMVGAWKQKKPHHDRSPRP